MTETSYFKVEFSNKTSENEDNNSTSTASNFQTILTKDLKLNDYLQLRTTHFEVALASLTIDNLPLAVTASENIIMYYTINLPSYESNMIIEKSEIETRNKETLTIKLQ